MKILKPVFLISFFAFFLSANGILVSLNRSDMERLSETDKNQLIELLRLKETFGGLVWPEFDSAEIPLIQYNEQFEFLVLHPNPPTSWLVVKNDTFFELPYYVRPAGQAQAFTLKVGDVWAGSLDTLDSMNRSLEKQIREEIPPEKLTPAFMEMMSISPAHHVVALLHESFHAFQAMTAAKQFASAQKKYAMEKDYPYENIEFQEAWNREGELLVKALRSKEEKERIELIQKFLETRNGRRLKIGLSPELVAFEQELEWLEGTAKYVEMRFAELGMTDTNEERAKFYRTVRGRLRMDFYSRLMKLGEQQGDLRFYLSGAAQALLLDSISIDWKQNFLSQQNLFLEDLLKK